MRGSHESLWPERSEAEEVLGWYTPSIFARRDRRGMPISSWEVNETCAHCYPRAKSVEVVVSTNFYYPKDAVTALPARVFESVPAAVARQKLLPGEGVTWYNGGPSLW